uniref:Stress responsive protein n=2 Tax=Oryza glaberrima TaxID=4538 RepID=I1QDA8_ORYGL
MDFYGRREQYGGYGGYGGGGALATPGYAPAAPYGMSQVNIEGNGCGRTLPPQPTVKVYCRANPNYAMTARNGAVVLAPANPKDEYQHWIKDMRWSTSIKDEEGYPAFALVNKATGQTIKHSLGQSHPVRLVPYNPEVMDESVLWTESRDVGNGFRCIRMVNNIYLNFDAFHGDKYHGGVRDGTDIVLWKWCEGDNQRWKIQPYY